MAYCTEDDLKKVIPEEIIIQLTDDVDPIDTIDPAIVDEMIAQADDEIDTYVVAKYDVPLAAPVPPIIRSISCDITVYKLYRRRMEEIPETRDTSYRDAVTLLKEIRDGKMPLPIDDTDPVSTFSTGVLITSHFGPETSIPGEEVG